MELNPRRNVLYIKKNFLVFVCLYMGRTGFVAQIFLQQGCFFLTDIMGKKMFSKSFPRFIFGTFAYSNCLGRNAILKLNAVAVNHL